MKSTCLGLSFAAVLVLFPGAQAAAAESKLDYDYYKARVEPIFQQKVEGHARCVVCHAEANNAFRLQKQDEKTHAWSEEASRKNFAQVSAIVTPGNPDKSHLLLYPLAPEAGGSIYHSGGRQFESKKDPRWQTIAAWVNGATLKK